MKIASASALSWLLGVLYLGRVLPTMTQWAQLMTQWTSFMTHNDAQCDFGNFEALAEMFKKQKYGLKDFLRSFCYMNDTLCVIVHHLWRTVRHCATIMLAVGTQSAVKLYRIRLDPYLNGLAPLWVCTWALRLDLSEKAFLHSGHSYGLSPVWVLRWP